ncbi:MAG: hypothetical protein R3C14_02020 [Caldilineaceae bacterium]
MLIRTTAKPLLTGWQAQVDASLEAGKQPLLELGINQRIMDDILTIAAFARLAATRQDPATSWILAGGEGVTWTATLLYDDEYGAVARPWPGALPVLVGYGGPELVTYMATLTTLRLSSQPPVLPPAMGPWLQPLAHPGVAPGWNALPLAVAQQEQGTVMMVDAPAQDEWLLWLVSVVVGALIILALFV